MKLTINELIALKKAALEKRRSLEWNVEEYQYDENGEAVYDENGAHVKREAWEKYPEQQDEYETLGTFLEKLENETV